MKKILLLLTIILSGCGSGMSVLKERGFTNEQINAIPKGATQLIVEKKVSKDALFDEMVRVLIDRGYRIEKESKDQGYITTEGKCCLQLSTSYRANIVFSENNGVSRAVIKSEWTANTGIAMYGVVAMPDWYETKWDGGQRTSIAFAESIAIANTIENAEISYK